MTTQQYPESSQATTALVLGILGIVVCGILAPFAWSIGNTEIRAIDAGRRDPANRGTASAGRILGIIGTVLLILGVLALVAFILLVVVVDVEFEQIEDELNSLRMLAAFVR
jgi:uncharacterized membrane protein YjgN (DUF898 family)